MAPNAETNDILTMTPEFSKVHSLKAAIFHTMAFKLSLEIHKNKITTKCLIAFLKVLYNVTQIKKKKGCSHSLSMVLYKTKLMQL